MGKLTMFLRKPDVLQGSTNSNWEKGDWLKLSKLSLCITHAIKSANNTFVEISHEFTKFRIVETLKVFYITNRVYNYFVS